MKALLRQHGSGYLVAVAATATTVLLRWLLDPLVGNFLPLATLYGAVAFAVWFGGYRPALLALVVGYLACDYLFIEPRGTLGFHDAQNLIGLILYLLSCAVIIGFGEALRAAQRRAEQQRESLRITLASMGDAVIATDAVGRVASLNPVAVALTGWTQDEAAGRPLEDVFHIINEQSRQPVENPVKIVLAKGQVVGLANHTTLIAKDGTERPIDDSAAPIKDARGHVLGVVLIFRDVTERRQAEKAARSLASIVESSDDAIIGKDVNGVITSWNRAAERLFGYSAREVVGRPIAVLAPPDRADEMPAIHARIRRGERVEHFDTVRRAKDGRLVPISLTVSPIKNEDGEVVGASKIARDISERKRAEEALREEKARLHATLTGIGDGVIVTDAESRVTLMNPVAQAVTGWKDEATGRPLEDVFRIIDQQTRHPVESPVGRVIHEGTVIGLANHTALVAQDGTERPIEDSAAPVRGEHGEIVGVVLVFRDATEQRRAEEALRQGEAQFRQLADFMPQIVWAARPDGYIDYYNERWYEYTGFPRGEYGEQSWKPILHPDDEQRSVDAYFGCIQAEKLYQIEYRFKDRKTGGYRWFLGRAMPVRDEQGKAVRWFGTCTDIDDTKQAEQELAGHSQRLREVAVASGMVHSAMTTENVLQIATEEARRIIGTHQSVSSLTVNQQWAQAINARSFSDKYARWGSYDAKTDGTGIYSVVCRTNKPLRLTQGELEAHPEYRRFGKEAGNHSPLRGWLAVPFVGRDGRNLGLIQLSDKLDGSDFTAEDEAILVQLATIASVAIENAELYEGLREADRRKDEFLATLAHELRNPLAPIRNSIELLRRAEGNTDLIGQASRIMERQVGVMVRLVDDLLDISRITRGKVQLRKERVELAAVVQSAVEECRPLIEAQSHELTVTLPPDPVYLEADPTRLGQVFANLLNNAAKYTEKGGHIWLTVERQGGEAVLSVRDTGIGIAAKHLPHLFEMFSQVDPALERSQGGLGIGLSLVRGLVELHGGTVEARSGGIGMGSEFTVRLPVAEGPAEAPQEPGDGERVKARSVRQRRILVVDDNRDAADSLVMMLQMAGHETATAYDGLEAVQAAATFRPDVVLLDIGLPKMNGLEAARHIREQSWGKGMTLLALTGWGQEEDKRRALEAGFDHHLTKPVAPMALEKLLAVLRAETG